MCLRLRGALAACAVVAALPVLAACSTDNGEGPSPLPTAASTTPAPSSSSPSGSSSPSVSPSTKPPARPPNADDYSAAGMKAFTKYAVGVFNYAYATGQTAPLERISTRACKPCHSVAADLRAIWEQGGKTQGSQLKIRFLDTIGPAPGVRPSAAATFSQSAYRATDATGKVTETVRAIPSAQLIFDLKRGGGRWFLDYFRRPSS